MSPATTLSDTETRADNPVKKPLHYRPGYGVDQTVIVLPVFDVAVTLGNVAPQPSDLHNNSQQREPTDSDQTPKSCSSAQDSCSSVSGFLLKYPGFLLKCARILHPAHGNNLTMRLRAIESATEGWKAQKTRPTGDTLFAPVRR